MFLRRLGKRGTAIVEYAIILAFVAAVGSSFTSDAGMAGSIKSIIGNVNQLLGMAAGKEEGKLTIAGNAEQWSGLLNNLYSNLMNLNPNKDKDLMEIKIHSIDQETGQGKVQYSYYGGGSFETDMSVMYSDGNTDYILKGQNFIRFNPDGTISAGPTEANNNAPTRIQIYQYGATKASEYIAYDESHGGFYSTIDYFANVNDTRRNPKT